MPQSRLVFMPLTLLYVQLHKVINGPLLHTGGIKHVLRGWHASSIAHSLSCL